jgi:hypothetical protein
MSIYWEHSVSGVQAEDFDMDKEDEDCEIQKPQMQSTKDEKQMKDLTGQHNIDFRTTYD